MDILGQSALLVAVTSLALGFSVVARNVKNKLFLAFAGICTLIGLWALCFFLEKIHPEAGFYRLHLLFNVWLAPASLAFIRVLVRIHDRLSRRFLDLSFLLALALSVALLFGMESTGWIRQLIYFTPGVIVLQILQLMWIDHRMKRGAKLAPKVPTVGLVRRNLIYMGALGVLCFSVMDHVPWTGQLIPVLGNLALSTYLFFISQAISQQRLLNLSALLSRFTVLMGVALTLTVIYFLLVGWVGEGAKGLFFLNSFIASFGILMLLEPLRAGVRSMTQRLLTQEHRSLEQNLREAQRRLAGIVDPSSLFQEILRSADDMLQPQWSALFILRTDGTKYRRVLVEGLPGDGSGPEPVREMIVNHLLLEHCRRLEKKGELPVLLDQILENEADRSASRTQKQNFAALGSALRALGGNLLIPLFDDERLLGFVMMHAPSPPEPWGSNWGILPLIYPFFQQAAQTLKGMEVFVRQKEKERLATIGEMAAGLAHEIRNPLGAIKGAAQFLDPSADRPEAKFLRVIIEETDRLNRVVTQFLDYSKPSTVELKNVDLGELTRRTVELLKPSLDPRIGLELAAPPAKSPVQAAPEQIQQVLINLIQNSVKALEGRPDPMIRVKVESSDAGGSERVFTVEDNGAGIRRENLEKLFIPFFTTSPSGTGLGLSICQKIIESHRGRIEVASEEGHFTRFSVVLPSAPGESA